jgi:hypothetical protein
MKMSYQRGRDLFLLLVGSLILIFEFLVAAPPPDTTIVIAAIGLMGSPAFLKRDEKEKQ